MKRNRRDNYSRILARIERRASKRPSNPYTPEQTAFGAGVRRGYEQGRRDGWRWGSVLVAVAVAGGALAIGSPWVAVFAGVVGALSAAGGRML